MRKLPITCLILVLFKANISFAQNVGINSSGVAPDASAMLDIVSTDKGTPFNNEVQQVFMPELD